MVLAWLSHNIGILYYHISSAPTAPGDRENQVDGNPLNC
jgi:hypothetical protein